MMLVEDSKLWPWTRRFGSTYPKLRPPETISRCVTCSATPRVMEDCGDSDDINLRQGFHRRVVQVHLRAQARVRVGTRWNYSNTGYLLLGLIINKVSGEFWGDLLQRRVFSARDADRASDRQ